MAITAYLDLDQGSDFGAVMELENDDGTPMDLSSVEIYSQFRKSYNSAVGYSFTCEIIDPLNGKFMLSLPGTVSSDIRAGRYLYDIEIYNRVINKKSRVVEGIVTINPEITRIP